MQSTTPSQRQGDIKFTKHVPRKRASRTAAKISRRNGLKSSLTNCRVKADLMNTNAASGSDSLVAKFGDYANSVEDEDLTVPIHQETGRSDAQQPCALKKYCQHLQ
jgi:hypothetical protein